MAHRFYKLKGKIHYRLKARHHHGFGIHSPYLFHLITSVLQEQYPYYYFGGIESLRKELYIKPVSFGRKKFVTRHSYKKDARCGQIIFRIIEDAQFGILLELGTSTGLETQYMALANQKARCISVTKSAELAAKARNGFQKQGLNHIELEVLRPGETTDSVLNNLKTLDFVLFNKLSGAQESLETFNKCLPKKNDGSIFVFMNIHGNPDMAEAWKKIRAHHEVQATIDLYDLGIALFKPELEKINYVIRT